MTVHEQIKEQIAARGLTESEGLRLLNDQAIISDLCQKVEDIALADAPRALNFLLPY